MLTCLVATDAACPSTIADNVMQVEAPAPPMAGSQLSTHRSKHLGNQRLRPTMHGLDISCQAIEAAANTLDRAIRLQTVDCPSSPPGRRSFSSKTTIAG